jgi:hypothetical protein
VPSSLHGPRQHADEAWPNFRSSPRGGDFDASGTARTDFTDQIVRVGLSYKFGEAYAPLK